MLTTYTPRREYEVEFDRCEAFMASLAATVTKASASGNYTPSGLFKFNADEASNAIYQTNRTLEAIATMAKKDRAAAEDALDTPEPLQSAETLAALAYQQALALRQFPDPNDKRIVGALVDAVEDGDAVRAQVLCDLAESIRWSLESMELMAQVERLRIRAIALRADPDRRAALDALALLDGDRETAGIDGKVRAIGDAVGQRATAIRSDGGVDAMAGSFRLAWVTPAVPALRHGAPVDFAGTVRMLGVIPARTR